MRRKGQLHHKVVVVISFDKRISRKDAVHEAQANIHGKFYTEHWYATDGSEREYAYPEMFRVRSVRSGGRT